MEPASQDNKVALLYERGELAVLELLIERVEAKTATGSELATLVALLGKAGTPGRSAGKGLKGGDEAAFGAWLASMPADEAERLRREAGKLAAGPLVPSGRRGGPKLHPPVAEAG